MTGLKRRIAAVFLATIAAIVLAIPAVGNTAAGTNGRGIVRTYWYRSVIGPCGQLQCVYQAPFSMFGRLKVGGKDFIGAFTIDSPGVKSLDQQWPAVAMHGRDRLGHTLSGTCYVYLAPSGSNYFLDCAGAIDGDWPTAVGISLRVFQDPMGVLTEQGVYPGTWVI